MPDDDSQDRHPAFFLGYAVQGPGICFLITKKTFLQKTSTVRSLGSDSVRHELKQRYDHHMTTKALFVRLEAKPGKENEVAKFLRDGQGLVQQEPATTAWFGIQLGPTTFAIFDAFPDDAGRDAHLSGKVAKALMEKAPELLAQPPKIEKADVLADRLPV